MIESAPLALRQRETHPSWFLQSEMLQFPTGTTDGLALLPVQRIFNCSNYSLSHSPLATKAKNTTIHWNLTPLNRLRINYLPHVHQPRGLEREYRHS